MLTERGAEVAVVLKVAMQPDQKRPEEVDAVVPLSDAPVALAT
jgi:hypothetical protein